MIGKPLADIAAFQWTSSNDIILDHLTRLPTARWHSVSYAQLVADPVETLLHLSRFGGLSVTHAQLPAGPLRLSRTALKPPDPQKWKRHEQALRALTPALDDVEARIRRVCAGIRSCDKPACRAPHEAGRYITGANESTLPRLESTE